MSREEIVDIENHLSECDSCCRTLEMVQDDTFVSLVRSAESETANDEEAERQQPEPTPMEAATLPPSASASATPFSPEGATARETDETLAEPALADHARYRVLELLGTGGMGAVYKAEHRLMGRTVAVKVITPRLVDNPSAVERFQREVQAAARLAHPNIVTAHDAEQAGNAHFLVMEYVEGISLAAETERQGRLPVAQACDYVRQAALGLQHAFECGMVHRDIKPHNLMLSVPLHHHGRESRGEVEKPIVKILDFGLAQFASQTATHGGLTQTGSIMGTPDYMAPEQARDAHAADIRADIYSLGCTLYCLLAGRPPFPGGSLVEKVMAHTEKEPAPLEEFRDDIPAGLQEVLKKMMAKDPAARYQTPVEAAAALKPFAEGEIAPAVAAAWDRSGIQRWLWPLVAAALLVLFASVIYIVTDKGRFEIRSDWDDVQVVVSEGGEQFEVIDLTSGSTVRRLPSGEYEMSLKGNNDLKLDKTGFTLTRGAEVIATVVRASTSRPKAEPAAATPGQATATSDGAEEKRASGGPTGNLVANPGFEDAADTEGKQAAYWIALAKTTPTEPEAQCYRDATTKFKGEASAVIVKAETKLAVAEAGFLQNIRQLPAGRKLVLSGYIKTKELDGAAYIRLNVVDPRKGPMPTKQCSTTPVSGTTDWQRYVADIEVPAGSAGELVLVIRGKGTARFDEVSLQVAPELPKSGGLANGGFEDLVNQMPKGWTPAGLGTEGLTFKADEMVKHDGGSSATIISTRDDQQPYNWRQELAENVPVGKTVKLTGWVKTKKAAWAGVGVQLLDANARMIAFHTTQHQQDFTGTADWKQFTLGFPVPNGTAKLAVLAMLKGRGQAWFDDFALVEERPATVAAGAEIKPAKKPSEAEKAAIEAAQAWLGLVDKEDYAKGWQESAGFVKSLTTESSLLKS